MINILLLNNFCSVTPYWRVWKKKRSTNYCIWFRSLVVVRNQLSSQVETWNSQTCRTKQGFCTSRCNLSLLTRLKILTRRFESRKTIMEQNMEHLQRNKNPRFLSNNAYEQHEKKRQNSHDKAWNSTLQTHTWVSIKKKKQNPQCVSNATHRLLFECSKYHAQKQKYKITSPDVAETHRKYPETNIYHKI